MSNLRHNAILALLLATCALLFFGHFSNGHDWGDDFAAYLMQARSLVEQAAEAHVESNRFTIESSSEAMGPVAYPWGFPALLAVVYSILGMNLTGFKLISLVAYLLFLATLHYGFRATHSRIHGVVLVAIFAFNPAMLRFGDQILSDIPFLLVSTVGVILIDRHVLQRQPLLHPMADGAVIGLVIALACSLRTIGVLLVPVLALAQAVRRYGRNDSSLVASRAAADEALAKPPGAKTALFLAASPYVVFLLLILLQRSIFPDGSSSYLAYARVPSGRELLESIRYNLALPVEFFGSVYVYAASVPFALAGMVKRRRRGLCFVVYCALIMVVCTLWPYRQGLRFIFPVLPFYVSFALSGVELVQTRISATSRKALILATALLPLYFLMVSAHFAASNLAAGRPTPDGPYSEASRTMFGFLADATLPTDVIVFRKPRALKLMIRRQSLRALTIDDASAGDYLVIDKINDNKQLTGADLRVLMASGRARLVHENRQFFVYALAPK